MMPSSASLTLSVDAPQVRRAMARSALYKFFSVAFAYPTAGRFRTLRDEALPTARAAASISGRRIAPRLETLFPHLEDITVEEMQSQYHRALGHLPLPDCPPYESGYLGDALFREENVLADVAGFYRAFGLLIGSKERERPDHVTVELEFMHVLTLKEAFALVHHGPAEVGICRRAQRRFWRDHLGRWLPSFGLLLAERAPEGFYKDVAGNLKEFAEVEGRALGKAEVVLKPRTQQPLPFEELDCSVSDGACPLERAGDHAGY
jgi:DMSO reductase family type II enzyme chaperone